MFSFLSTFSDACCDELDGRLKMRLPSEAVAAVSKFYNRIITTSKKF